MRILSNEHAAEVQLLDLSRLTRFRELCFNAGPAADALACEFLDAEVRHPRYPVAKACTDEMARRAEHRRLA